MYKQLLFFLTYPQYYVEKGLTQDTLHMSMEEQLLMFLNIVRHNKRNDVIAHNFLRSDESVNRYFNHILFAIGKFWYDM